LGQFFEPLYNEDKGAMADNDKQGNNGKQSRMMKQIESVMGYSGVFQGNPHPYPSKPAPASTGTGFMGMGDRFSQTHRKYIIIYKKYIYIHNILFTTTRRALPSSPLMRPESLQIRKMHEQTSRSTSPLLE